MIDLQFSFQVSADAKSLIVEDQTVWPSEGTERSAINLLTFSQRVLGKDFINETFIANGNSKSSDKWTLLDANDGYYKTILIAVFDLNPELPYVKNSLVYFENKIYVASKNLLAGVSTQSENCWDEVLNIDQILNMTSFPNSSYLIGHFLKDDSTNVCIGEKAIHYAKQDCGCSDKCSMIEDYSWTTIYHAAAIYSFGFGDYAESGKFLGMALGRCGTGITPEPCNCH